MVAANTDQGSDAFGVRLMQRLSAARWLILATAAILLALLAAGALTAGVAALAFLALAAAIVLLPGNAGALAEDGVRAPTSAERASETMLRHFAEALPEPCFILDRRGTVRYANERAVTMFSIRAGEAIAFRLRVPDLVAAFDKLVKGGPPARVEFSERVPTERWFAAWFARLDAGGAEAEGLVLLLIEDLSEQRKADRVRVDFVANASHELRTPLASLAGFIETLQGPAREDPNARDRFLMIMHEQAGRMSRLVDDLLSLSRIEMKAHVRPSDRVDLAEMIGHVVDTLEPLASELGVVIEVKPAETPLVVVGDRDELTQVFSNLIENACKYGQSGKRVEVSLAAGRNGGGAVVTVRDFGPGIPEEHVPRLTERFYRIDVEDSRRHRGTGLGLAIVKHILARHHARMAIESRLGEGAAFAVTFAPIRTTEPKEKALKSVT